MKHLLFIFTFTALAQITLTAQFDQEGIVEKETTLTKEVEVNEENGILTVKILTKDGKGNEEVTEWKGTADDPNMPDEVRVIVEDGINSSSNKKQIRLKILDDNGQEKLLEWDGEGEMPEEMKQLLEENDHDIHFNKEDHKGHHAKKRATRKIEYDPNAAPEFNGRGYGHKYGGKAKMGIKIAEENGSVVVVETIPGTGAEAAGVLKGDLIAKLDDTEIDSLDRLFAELATHNPGDKVKLVVSRNGKEKTLNLNLK